MRTVYAALVALLLQGCANPFAQFYTRSSLTPPGGFEPQVGEPQLVQGQDPKTDQIRLYEDGYALIGYSSFNAAKANSADALAQGKTVGASVILIYSKYRNTVSGVFPLTVPSTQTSYTNVSGMVGSSPVYGTGTTTTYGTSTTYVPYSVDRSDYLATYWARVPPAPVGVLVREPTADERGAIGTNSGLMVVAVRKGSAAFNADIFRGDILMRIGDIALRQLADLSAVRARYAGQAVQLTLRRDGHELMKTLTLNPAPNNR